MLYPSLNNFPVTGLNPLFDIVKQKTDVISSSLPSSSTLIKTSLKNDQPPTILLSKTGSKSSDTVILNSEDAFNRLLKSGTQNTFFRKSRKRTKNGIPNSFFSNKAKKIRNETNVVPEKLTENTDNKLILDWLTDKRNKFDNIKPTQQDEVSVKITQNSFSMASVSQHGKRLTEISDNEVQKGNVKNYINSHNRRTRSLDVQIKGHSKRRQKRHSTSDKFPMANNNQIEEYSENDDLLYTLFDTEAKKTKILKLMEEEILNNIEAEMRDGNINNECVKPGKFDHNQKNPTMHIPSKVTNDMKCFNKWKDLNKIRKHIHRKEYKRSKLPITSKPLVVKQRHPVVILKNLNLDDSVNKVTKSSKYKSVLNTCHIQIDSKNKVKTQLPKNNSCPNDLNSTTVKGIPICLDVMEPEHTINDNGVLIENCDFFMRETQQLFTSQENITKDNVLIECMQTTDSIIDKFDCFLKLVNIGNDNITDNHILFANCRGIKECLNYVKTAMQNIIPDTCVLGQKGFPALSPLSHSINNNASIRKKALHTTCHSYVQTERVNLKDVQTQTDGDNVNELSNINLIRCKCLLDDRNSSASSHFHRLKSSPQNFRNKNVLNEVSSIPNNSELMVENTPANNKTKEDNLISPPGTLISDFVDMSVLNLLQIHKNEKIVNIQDSVQRKYKRMRTPSSDNDSDAEIQQVKKNNRFVKDDLSVRFVSEPNHPEDHVFDGSRSFNGNVST